MALPLITLAAAAKILGPKAYKAAKAAYKMSKKKNKTGNKTTKKTKKLSEQKFISDKARKVKKNKDEIKKGEDALDRHLEARWEFPEPGAAKMTRIQKKKSDIATYDKMMKRYDKGKLGDYVPGYGGAVKKKKAGGTVKKYKHGGKVSKCPRDGIAIRGKTKG